MRRQYSGRADSMVKSAEGEQGFWPSYADMMSAVALILFFLMLLSYIQNLITGNNLQNTQELLDDTKTRLASTELELKDTEDTLALTLKQVEDAESELSKVTVDLDRVKLTLAEKEDDLAAQDQLLSNQAALLQEQEEYMKAASKEILELRGQMQTIAVLRLSILEQIRDSVVKVMGDASKVSIGENGNIVLSEGVFFDVGSSAIKAGAIPTLNQLIDVFQRFLSDPASTSTASSSPATRTAPARMRTTASSPPTAPTPCSGTCWITAAASCSSTLRTSARPVTARPAPWPTTRPKRAGRRTAASKSPSS